MKCLQVSRLQVAELVAAAVANPELTENKVSNACLRSPSPWMSTREKKSMPRHDKHHAIGATLD